MSRRSDVPALLHIRAPRRFAGGAFCVALGLIAAPALAQEAGGDFLGALSDGLSQLADGSGGGGDGGPSLSGRILQLLALMTILSIAPGLLVVMTSFTRFVIVFSMLRSALGLNQTPPNMVLNAMALFMTFFVMQPVFEDAWTNGMAPLIDNAIAEDDALVEIAEPFKTFMFVNTRPRDYALFQGIAQRAGGDAEAELVAPETAAEAGWRELVPAFMISELRRAFTIGFLIYLPFVAIDLIVASVLMSAGMMMLPPVLISLPFKVIFFVLIDGWYMLAGSLMESYLPLGGGG
ncbi:flagellar biosynthetic protein FliP [Mesobaculum littorinae]|uniref:Flagellar biosynthetic protein FliP n=1 Tax=Mesobaculum littorinae TaxID=2486419 RepID=A0A438ADX8_9RHOB|nr:flagellar type III secretion system pore protein FliP [Mesobaculum littorinae]RVV96875.1 flagellar biosynthetic protein FliP [Mesobaculum littorinae]